MWCIVPYYISNPAYRKYGVSIIIKCRNGQLRERHSLNCNAIGKLSISINEWNVCVRIRDIIEGEYAVSLSSTNWEDTRHTYICTHIMPISSDTSSRARQ